MKLARLICLAGVLSAGSAHAFLTVEPIVGYERVQKLLPSAHTRDRLVYGGRAIVGLPMLSVEAEYTRAGDSETFVATNTIINDTEDKARVGLRSGFGLGSLFGVFLRGGAQARLTRHETVTAGVPVTTYDPPSYNPYAGAGLRLGFGKKIALTADLTVVMKDFPLLTNNEYMATAGFAISLP